MAEKLSKADLERVGEVVAQRRTEFGWGKEQAAREAGISSITWKRVEDGLPVQDAKLASVFRALKLHGFGVERGVIRITNDQSSVELRTIESIRESRRHVISLEEEIDLAVRLVARLRVDLARAEENLTALTRRAAEQGQPSQLSAAPDTSEVLAAATDGAVEEPGEF